MKLKFNIDINHLTTWFRPCYYCKYFALVTQNSGSPYRECSRSSNTYFMMCYTNEGKMLPDAYTRNFKDRSTYKKL